MGMMYSKDWVTVNATYARAIGKLRGEIMWKWHWQDENRVGREFGVWQP
jgi:hypothetical protein